MRLGPVLFFFYCLFFFPPVCCLLFPCYVFFCSDDAQSLAGFRRPRYFQAEPLLKNVLALREKVLGPDHVDAAESLVNLAVLNNRKVGGVVAAG